MTIKISFNNKIKDKFKRSIEETKEIIKELTPIKVEIKRDK